MSYNYHSKSKTKGEDLLKDYHPDLLNIQLSSIIIRADIHEFNQLLSNPKIQKENNLFLMVDAIWEWIEDQYEKSNKIDTDEYYDSLYGFSTIRQMILESKLKDIILKRNKAKLSELKKEGAFHHLVTEQIVHTIQDTWHMLEDQLMESADFDIIMHSETYTFVKEIIKDIPTLMQDDTPCSNDISTLDHIVWIS